MQTIQDYLKLFLKGVAMGGADVVPGVSGGTIAFITGIYETLLNAIKSVDAEAFRLLLQFRIADLWKHINGGFLITLLGGIILSIITFAQVIHFLLDNYPIQLWSFFFGLVVISAISVTREIYQWSAGVVIAGLAGIAIAYWVTEATPGETPEALWFIFLSGAIAICAMILPGISGSFILLIMGKYTYILEAVNERNFVVVGVFAIGCIVGILSFARVISWLLKNYHNMAIALLAGFMIGSLNKIWPWKMVASTRINSSGEEVPFLTKNVLPASYEQITGDPSFLWQAMLFAILGVAIVVVLEQVAARSNKKVAKTV